MYMTAVGFDGPGCDKTKVSDAGILATGSACTPLDPGTYVKADCQTAALPTTFNRVTYDPASPTCASSGSVRRWAFSNPLMTWSRGLVSLVTT